MNEINIKIPVEYIVKFPQSSCGFAYMKKKRLFGSLKEALSQKGVEVTFLLQAEKGINELELYERNGEAVQLIYSSGQGEYYHSCLCDGSNKEDLIEKLYLKSQAFNSFK
jgi:hypothetical protein